MHEMRHGEKLFKRVKLPAQATEIYFTMKPVFMWDCGGENVKRIKSGWSSLLKTCMFQKSKNSSSAQENLGPSKQECTKLYLQDLNNKAHKKNQTANRNFI